MTAVSRSSNCVRHSLKLSLETSNKPRIPISPFQHNSRRIFSEGVEEIRNVVVRVAAPQAPVNGALAYKPETPAPRRSESLEAKMHEYGGHTRVSLISSPEDFNDVITQNPTKVVVLMCKAKSCRPCKMFSRKYSRLADNLQDCIFLDVYGDENTETRQMMMEMKVKATPTFRIYRGHAFLTAITGANEKKLSGAITAVLQPDEVGYLEPGVAQEDVPPTDSDGEDD